jgi:hypothetical protein
MEIDNIIILILILVALLLILRLIKIRYFPANINPPSGIIGGCKGTQYGCCPDGRTACKDETCSNCLIGGCKGTQFGCCPDESTACSDLECSNCLMDATQGLETVGPVGNKNSVLDGLTNEYNQDKSDFQKAANDITNSEKDLSTLNSEKSQIEENIEYLEQKKIAFETHKNKQFSMRWINDELVKEKDKLASINEAIEKKTDELDKLQTGIGNEARELAKSQQTTLDRMTQLLATFNKAPSNEGGAIGDTLGPSSDEPPTDGSAIGDTLGPPGDEPPTDGSAIGDTLGPPGDEGGATGIHLGPPSDEGGGAVTPQNCVPSKIGSMYPNIPSGFSWNTNEMNHGDEIIKHCSEVIDSEGKTMYNGKLTVKCNNGDIAVTHDCQSTTCSSFNCSIGIYETDPTKADEECGHSNNKCTFNNSFDDVACCQKKSSNNASCTGPDDTVIAHGNGNTYYQNSSDNECRGEIRNCNNGTLSGSFSHNSCTVEEPAAECPDGTFPIEKDGKKLYRISDSPSQPLVMKTEAETSDTLICFEKVEIGDSIQLSSNVNGEARCLQLNPWTRGFKLGGGNGCREDQGANNYENRFVKSKWEDSRKLQLKTDINAMGQATTPGTCLDVTGGGLSTHDCDEDSNITWGNVGTNDIAGGPRPTVTTDVYTVSTTTINQMKYYNLMGGSGNPTISKCEDWATVWSDGVDGCKTGFKIATGMETSNCDTLHPDGGGTSPWWVNNICKNTKQCQEGTGSCTFSGDFKEMTYQNLMGGGKKVIKECDDWKNAWSGGGISAINACETGLKMAKGDETRDCNTVHPSSGGTSPWWVNNICKNTKQCQKENSCDF